jgi:hypothetical protein
MKEDVMSKLKSLALSGVFAAACFAAVPAEAQVVLQRGGTTVTAGPATVTRLDPIRPDRDRPDRDRPDRRHDHSNLEERLRNACFNSPNPPVQICRRFFGDHGR